MVKNRDTARLGGRAGRGDRGERDEGMEGWRGNRGGRGDREEWVTSFPALLPVTSKEENAAPNTLQGWPEHSWAQLHSLSVPCDSRERLL